MLWTVRRYQAVLVFSPAKLRNNNLIQKKLANLIANTETFGQITLNTKPHSDPLTMIFRTPTIAKESV